MTPQRRTAPSIQGPRRGLNAVVAVVALLGLGASVGGCGRSRQLSELEKPRNVKPPHLGAPARIADVTGIYRSLSQNLLQLRQDGTLVLVTTAGGPTSGSYRVSAGELQVRTAGCHDDGGHYRMLVTGQQRPNKARLQITLVEDPCAPRAQALTQETWTYVES